MKKKTRKQELYLDEILRLHRERGYGEGRISRILPVSHSTISRWIRKFAVENQSRPTAMTKKDSQEQTPSSSTSPMRSGTVESLQAELSRLQSELRADVYNEMINIAEATFKIPIRKKSGAKQ
jgi:transposase-like protein